MVGTHADVVEDRDADADVHERGLVVAHLEMRADEAVEGDRGIADRQVATKLQHLPVHGRSSFEVARGDVPVRQLAEQTVDRRRLPMAVLAH